jgi:hypothetical protein
VLTVGIQFQKTPQELRAHFEIGFRLSRLAQCKDGNVGSMGRDWRRLPMDFHL